MASHPNLSIAVAAVWVGAGNENAPCVVINACSCLLLVSQCETN
jgi:hypothetical protein